MRKKIAALFLTAGLLAALALPVVPVGAQQAVRYPELHKADAHLTQAAEALQTAAHHYRGHREKAEELIRQAQAEINQAVEYGNAHRENY